MKKGYKKCPYCGEEIREIAIKCRFCHEFLDDNINETKKEYLEDVPNKDRNKNDGNINRSKKHKKIYRHSLDKSIIECNVCGYKGEGGRKEQGWLVDFLSYFFLGTLLLVIANTFNKELVICPECGTSNVTEIECEKVGFFTKLGGLLFGIGIVIGIIYLISLCL